MDYLNTFWGPSEYGKSVGIPSCEIYAIVAVSQYKDRFIFKAWKMEVRASGLYHPAYGIIPGEYCEKYDLFVHSSKKSRPNYEFDTRGLKYKQIAKNIKELKKFLWPDDTHNLNLSAL